MTTSAKTSEITGKRVHFVRVGSKVFLSVLLNDGRLVGVPASLYPTLLKATPAQRARYRTIGGGHGFHWPALDLDLSVAGIVRHLPEAGGRRSRRSA